YNKEEIDQKIEEGGGGSSVEVLQTTGQSSTATMSQKASTDSFELKGTAYSKTESDSRYETKGGGGSDITIEQTTGQSTSSVMSQKAVTDELAKINTEIGSVSGSVSGLSSSVSQLDSSVSSVSGKVSVLESGLSTANKDIDDIQAILDARFPFTITSFTGGKVVENNTSTSVALAWVYDGIPTSQELKQGSTVISTVLTDRAKTVSDLTGAGNDIVFTISANGKSRTTTLQFRNCKRIGNVTSAPATEANVNALTKIAATTSRAYTWNGALNNNAVAYCYPKSFGALTSIKDANNFEYLSSFTRTEVTANGELYYVYTSPVATAASFRYVFA
ncbi:MAG: hypothetical protein ACRC6V_01355, partial [Bacteroidales bacterium]